MRAVVWLAVLLAIVRHGVVWAQDEFVPGTLSTVGVSTPEIHCIADQDCAVSGSDSIDDFHKTRNGVLG